MACSFNGYAYALMERSLTHRGKCAKKWPASEHLLVYEQFSIAVSHRVLAGRGLLIKCHVQTILSKAIVSSHLGNITWMLFTQLTWVCACECLKLLIHSVEKILIASEIYSSRENERSTEKVVKTSAWHEVIEVTIIRTQSYAKHTQILCILAQKRIHWKMFAELDITCWIVKLYNT